MTNRDRDKLILEHIRLCKAIDVLIEDIDNNHVTISGITQAIERLLITGLSKGLISTYSFNNHIYGVTKIRDEMFDKLNEITLRG